MLLEYFGLNEEPFGVTPDPRFIYYGSSHREALASLTYGTEANRGFLALIAKPGMGKTSLLYQYLESLKTKARTAFLFQTDCHRRELLRHILADLGHDATGKDLPTIHQMFNNLLEEEMRAGRRVILVIDEAQNLEPKALESIRLLSNFETPWMKLVQIVIAGQPELAARLSMPALAQLRQRISMILRIEPFAPEEVGEYIRHRLWVAGYSGPPLFTIGAQTMIASRSEGIPRNINNICFNALSLACALKRKVVNREILNEVLADLDLEPLKSETLATGKTKQSEKLSEVRTPLKLKKKRSFGGWVLKLAAASVLILIASWPLKHADAIDRAMNVSPSSSRGPSSLVAPTVMLRELDVKSGRIVSASQGGNKEPAPAQSGQSRFRQANNAAFGALEKQ